MPDDGTSYHPDTPYAHLMARITERRIAVLDQLRRGATHLLDLQPGDRVIDAGCGTGASFPYLLDQVGSSGEVVGVEINPYLVEKARTKIQENGWKNVQVVEAAAQTASLSGEFDGLLLFATQEILTSSEALDCLLPYLKDRARVVAFGARQVRPPLGWLFNPLFRLASEKWLPNAAPIDTQPWRLLMDRLTEIRVGLRLGGLVYLVWGRKADTDNTE